MTHTLKQTAKAGFTLVELAIVLVIIGLIVGGVLVGQDLIKAAEIRATIADIESYNSGATTFRNKFSGLPGDLLASRASQYGLTTRSGDAGHGDGNSVLEGCAAGDTALGCETALFWVDLTTAELIADAYDTATDILADNLNATGLEDYLPSTPLREIAKVHVFPQAGRNYFFIGNLTTAATTALPTPGTTPAGLTPAEAEQIDNKVDDGFPLTGIVRSVSAFATTSATLTTTANAATGVCVADDIITGEDLYNVANEDFASELNCHIYYRSSF